MSNGAKSAEQTSEKQSPAHLYQERMERYESMLADHLKGINRIGNWRLFVFLAGAGWADGFGLLHRPLLAWIGGALWLALFVWLVLVHDRLYRARRQTAIRRDINREGWQRLTDQWHDIADDGHTHVNAEHPYSEDLDLFGSGSLFQWSNAAVTPGGRNCLVKWLTEPEQNPRIIAARQEAVRELAPMLEWRQDLQTEARLHEGEFCEADALAKWANAGVYAGQGVQGLLFHLMRVLSWMLPFATLVMGAMPTFDSEFRYSPFILLLLLETMLLIWRFKPRTEALHQAERAAADIRVHQQILERLESMPFQSVMLREMKERLKDGHKHSASGQARRLARIVDGLGNRRHQLYIVIDILFLLDWHFYFAIDRWKAESAAHLADWVAVNGELEALCSLAGIGHAHPDWVMPIILPAGTGHNGTDQAGTDQPGTGPAGTDQEKSDAAKLVRFRASDLGHPLLKTPCVTNPVVFHTPESVHLITGSNMSGKSTLLRTIGLNLVLAMAGAPVFASAFAFSPCHLYTCMRTRDDIEHGISSFYAELLRIKTLVRAVEAGESVFCFLDEIFKGTNSADRHVGAQALINWLVARDAPDKSVLGLISTHDLELGVLADTSPGVRNEHFQEYYEEGALRFDYKLRPGVSTTRNALWLMKLAGLPTDL